MIDIAGQGCLSYSRVSTSFLQKLYQIAVLRMLSQACVADKRGTGENPIVYRNLKFDSMLMDWFLPLSKARHISETVISVLEQNWIFCKAAIYRVFFALGFPFQPYLDPPYLRFIVSKLCMDARACIDHLIQSARERSMEARKFDKTRSQRKRNFKLRFLWWFSSLYMGISGLLPVLKSISHRVHVSKYSGKRVAVDAYSWLHKGAYGCSKELCEGIPTDRSGKALFCSEWHNRSWNILL